MNLSGVTIACFASSYAVSLVLEVASLRRRFGWHRMVMLLFAAIGVSLHLVYLANFAHAAVTPLASPAEWYLVVALVLAGLYLWGSFRWPDLALGIFLLPLVIALVAAGWGASREPFTAQRASLVWGQVHAWTLVLATVTMCVGFSAGLMYLVQSWRLKQKLAASPRFRLPSLELLERINSHSLGLSTALVAGGFASGLALVSLRHQGEANYSLLADPVVLGLAAMQLWLIAAEVFRWVYPSARRGRKVAYLTLASFGFLVIALGAMLLTSPVHQADTSKLSVVSRQLLSASGHDANSLTTNN
jgi:ABC-type uncharacterized transport system permease subunit